MHRTAAWCNRMGIPQFFAPWLRDQIEGLPCADCRGHAREHLAQNPPERAIDPSLYMWQFHSAVNQRLGKPNMDWETYYVTYVSPRS